MAVPSDVRAESDELHVEGRSLMAGGLLSKEHFRFGDYAVTEVSRGGSGSGATPYPTFAGFDVDSESRIAFTFKHGADVLPGACVAETHESSTELVRVKLHGKSARFGCACGDPGAPAATMTLVLPASGLGIEGSMNAGGTPLSVKALYDLEGAGPASDPSGYRVDGERGVAAAVDVLGGGRAWMGKSVDALQRTAVACMLAGLFLYRPPGSDAHPSRIEVPQKHALPLAHAQRAPRIRG
ncbi:MAG: hypothetical protein ACRENE_25060 [Polyangiaceae bacterium]